MSFLKALDLFTMLINMSLGCLFDLWIKHEFGMPFRLMNASNVVMGISATSHDTFPHNREHHPWALLFVCWGLSCLWVTLLDTEVWLSVMATDSGGRDGIRSSAEACDAMCTLGRWHPSFVKLHLDCRSDTESELGMYYVGYCWPKKNDCVWIIPKNNSTDHNRLTPLSAQMPEFLRQREQTTCELKRRF